MNNHPNPLIVCAILTTAQCAYSQNETQATQQESRMRQERTTELLRRYSPDILCGPIALNLAAHKLEIDADVANIRVAATVLSPHRLHGVREARGVHVDRGVRRVHVDRADRVGRRIRRITDLVILLGRTVRQSQVNFPSHLSRFPILHHPRKDTLN